MTSFKGLHSVSIKVIQDAAMDSIPTAHRLVDAFISNIDSGNLQSLRVHPQDSLETMQRMLKEHFGDSISFRDGCMDGCYGATTGRILSGFTADIDAMELPERCETGEGDERTEWFNPLATLESAGFELLLDNEDLVDAFIEEQEAAGLKVLHDNTYNQSGMSETVEPFYTVDMKCIETKDGFYAALMFHHGGDPRGNYGTRYLFKAKSIYDWYEAMVPSWYGAEDES